MEVTKGAISIETRGFLKNRPKVQAEYPISEKKDR